MVTTLRLRSTDTHHPHLLEMHSEAVTGDTEDEPFKILQTHPPPATAPSKS